MSNLQTRTPAINLPEEDRAAFVMRVYQHILAAIGAFVAIEALFFATGIAEGIYNFFAPRWLFMIGLLMLGQFMINGALRDIDNPSRQYGALFGSSALYAVLFAVPLHRIYRLEDAGSTVLSAAVVTAIGFAMLTAVAFTTRKDLSFLRPIVMWGVGAAFLLIVASVVMGWNLGTWFSVGMVALMGASILWQTQTIIRRYPGYAHVAGAVALFSSLMTMFYYVLQLFSGRD